MKGFSLKNYIEIPVLILMGTLVALLAYPLLNDLSASGQPSDKKIEKTELLKKP